MQQRWPLAHIEAVVFIWRYDTRYGERWQELEIECHSAFDNAQADSLTDRELEVLHLYDRTIREIAHRLDIGIATVRSHWKSIKDKLGIHSRWEVPFLLGHKGPLQDSPSPLQTTLPGSNSTSRA